MNNFNISKSNTMLIIVIFATSLTDVIALRQAEVLVNESAFISCFSKEVKNIQWHHTPPRKRFNDYVYAGGEFKSSYRDGRFQVHNDLTTNMYTLIITNVTHADAGLYECKDDKLFGVFGSTYLTVLDSSPVCTSNMNPNGFVGPNTCDIGQENMIFSCAVSFSGKSPNLIWSTVSSRQTSNSSICESNDNKINCSLSLKADPSFDGSTFICQTTTSNDARHKCSIEDIRVEYFFGDYEAVEKKVGDNVTCVVVSNQQIHYNWTIQQSDQDVIFSKRRMIYLQKPGFYKCIVKYNIRDVTCYAPIVAVNVSIIVDDSRVEGEEPSAMSISLTTLAIVIAVAVLLCIASVAISRLIFKRKYDSGIKSGNIDANKSYQNMRTTQPNGNREIADNYDNLELSEYASMGAYSLDDPNYATIQDNGYLEVLPEADDGNIEESDDNNHTATDDHQSEQTEANIEETNDNNTATDDNQSEETKANIEEADDNDYTATDDHQLEQTEANIAYQALHVLGTPSIQ